MQKNSKKIFKFLKKLKFFFSSGLISGIGSALVYGPSISKTAVIYRISFFW